MDEFCLENPINFIQRGRRARLVALERDDPSFIEVSKLFDEGWKHPRKKPYLCYVYRIVSTEKSIEPYHTYRSSLSEPNERLLFHGTNRSCFLGEGPHNALLCASLECSLCFIIRNSFDIERCGNKHKFGRFGTGIYTSACSSKADDYSRNIDAEAGMRVLLLNRVVLGRSIKIRRNAVNLTEPPVGYDSVTGVPGIDLNYEETVVYTNDAIRPCYLLVYSDHPLGEHPKLQDALRRLFNKPFLPR